MSVIHDPTLRRVHLVTTRYRELQGLRLACYASTVAATCAAYLMAGLESAWTVFVAGGVIGAVIFFLRRRLNAYYATFGRVTIVDVPWQALVVTGAQGLAIFIDRSPFLVVLSALSVVSLIVAIRDWPLRRYYLFGVAGCSMAALLQLTPEALSAPHVVIPGSLAIASLAFIPIGLLDHQLLATTMKRVSEGESESEPEASRR
jgi:hypothetical protein